MIGKRLSGARNWQGCCQSEFDCGCCETGLISVLLSGWEQQASLGCGTTPRKVSLPLQLWKLGY